VLHSDFDNKKASPRPPSLRGTNESSEVDFMNEAFQKNWLNKKTAATSTAAVDNKKAPPRSTDLSSDHFRFDTRNTMGPLLHSDWTLPAKKSATDLSSEFAFMMEVYEESLPPCDLVNRNKQQHGNFHFPSTSRALATGDVTNDQAPSFRIRDRPSMVQTTDGSSSFEMEVLRPVGDRWRPPLSALPTRNRRPPHWTCRSRMNTLAVSTH
jgi:hypothetical protein